MWVSLIWAKLKLAGADWAAASPIARDESTPPATDQSSAGPRPRHALQKPPPLDAALIAHDSLLTTTLPVIIGCKVQKYV